MGSYNPGSLALSVRTGKVTDKGAIANKAAV